MKKLVMLFCAVALVLVILMTEPAVAALDVSEINIHQRKVHRDNTAVANPYEFSTTVWGTGITSASVVDPHGFNHIIPSGVDGAWFTTGGFTTLPLLDASYGPGDYVFTFNAGEADEDTVTVNYQYTETTGFANITYPADGQTNVPLNPVYIWDSVAGYANADALFLWLEQGGHRYIESGVIIDMTTTSWQPGPLDPLTEYELYIEVMAAQDGIPTEMQTDTLADNFTYYGFFDYVNSVGFETVPEPVTLSLLLIGGLALVRRRRA